jgi:hypothetical protein
LIPSIIGLKASAPFQQRYVINSKYWSGADAKATIFAFMHTNKEEVSY